MIPTIRDSHGVEWLYALSDDMGARYVLGTPGEHPLICIGLNPSTAVPGSLDRTVSLVAEVAERAGHDSFVMLNVYPERETHPDRLERDGHAPWIESNLAHMAAVVNGNDYTIWAAWGAYVDKRPYLLPMVREVISMPELGNGKWVSRGLVTKHKHPHHPLYVRQGTSFEEFDLLAYQRAIGA